jgi:hypothetical protein
MFFLRVDSVVNLVQMLLTQGNRNARKPVDELSEPKLGCKWISVTGSQKMPEVRLCGELTQIQK